MFEHTRSSDGAGARYLGIAVLLGLVVATFFLSGADNPLGEFFISRELLWTGRSFGKTTFAMVFFTLLSAVVGPLVLVTGVRDLLARRDGKPMPPAFRETAIAHESRAATHLLRGALVWLLLAASMTLVPARLAPLGVVAVVLLVALPALPLVLVFLLLEVVGRPRYVEGRLECLDLVEDEQGHREARLTVAGQEFVATPEAVATVRAGGVVGLLAASSQRVVLHIEPRDSGP
jgi:hypothetical protein